jgi:hypothetical protein
MSSDGLHTEILRATPTPVAPEETDPEVERVTAAEIVEDDAARSDATLETADHDADIEELDEDEVVFRDAVPTEDISAEEVSVEEVPAEEGPAEDVPLSEAPLAEVPPVAAMTTSEAGAVLLTREAEQRFLEHWKEIQIAFVEDPQRSVEDADTLVGEIAAAWQRAVHERRKDLAADWERGEPDTEELRTALLRYRTFIGVLLPK